MLNLKKRFILSAILTIIVCTLTNKYWLLNSSSIKPCFSFDIELFIIIAILSFLFIYKITSYIADFSTIKEKSRIDIFFLLIFFIFLLIPSFKIDKKEISTEEQRPLAKFKPLILDKKINYNFGNDFNNWFNDRFNLRNTMLSVYGFIDLHSANNTQGIVDREFLYTKENDFLPISKQKIIESFDELKKFENFLNKNNIKLYVLIVPQKYMVYPPSTKKFDTKEDYLFLINQIRKNTGLKIIYPLEALKNQSKTEYVFYKTDHHWSEQGAFVGYIELMKEIKKDYPDIKIASENDFNITYSKKVKSDFDRTFHRGSSCFILNVPKTVCSKHLNVKYKYFEHKDSSDLKITVFDESKNKSKFYHYPKGSNLKAVLYGTSMNENLSDFLPYSFKDTYRLRNNNVIDVPIEDDFKLMKYYKNKILDFKPDIFIYSVTIPNLSQVYQIFNLE